MDMKRIAIGTLVGAIALQAAGFVLYDMIVGGFYAANASDAGRAVFRVPPLRLAFVLADLSLAALLTLAVTLRNSTTLGAGFVTGAVIGLLFGVNVSAGFYGNTTIWALPAHLVHPLVVSLHAGIAGAVIAAVLARVPRSVGIQPAH